MDRSEMSTDPVTGGEIMLFGVRVVVDSMRKSVSLNNLSQYEHLIDKDSTTATATATTTTTAAGYASADDAVQHSSSTATATVSRERKRGVPWTEEEHKLFLLGLQKVGKGDWRGISRNFVKTRTPTQVASHAQKYFLRRSNLNRRRRRSSLFDITTDTVGANPTNDQQIVKENNGGASQSPPSPPPAPAMKSTETTRCTAAPIYPVAQAPSRQSMVDLDLNTNSLMDPSPLSLNLSLSMTSDLEKARRSVFEVVQGFNNGDSMISVA